MIGKKDNHDIFKQYKSILLEQVEDEFSALINKIKTSSLDQVSKDQLIKMVSAQKEHGMGDADAAGYASYPEAMPVGDQDDEDTANEPDSDFAKDMAEAQKEQNKKYPEQDDEDEMPTEAPWWVPGDENKQRWLATQQGHWKQAQKEKEENQS